MASSLGCDCMNRIKNAGSATLLNEMFPKLVTWKPKEAMQVINDNLKQKMTNQRVNEFSHSINLFRFSPVLNCDDELVPSNGDFDDDKWGNIIGFNANLNDSFPVDEEMRGEAKSFNECSSIALDSSELKEHASPTRGDLQKYVDKGVPMPLFSMTDFKAIPIRCCAPLKLQKFVD